MQTISDLKSDIESLKIKVNRLLVLLDEKENIILKKEQIIEN